MIWRKITRKYFLISWCNRQGCSIDACSGETNTTAVNATAFNSTFFIFFSLKHFFSAYVFTKENFFLYVFIHWQRSNFKVALTKNIFRLFDNILLCEVFFSVHFLFACRATFCLTHVRFYSNFSWKPPPTIAIKIFLMESKEKKLFFVQSRIDSFIKASWSCENFFLLFARFYSLALADVSGWSQGREFCRDRQQTIFWIFALPQKKAEIFMVRNLNFSFS